MDDKRADHTKLIVAINAVSWNCKLLKTLLPQRLKDIEELENKRSTLEKENPQAAKILEKQISNTKLKMGLETDNEKPMIDNPFSCMCLRMASKGTSETRTIELTHQLLERISMSCKELPEPILALI